MWPGRTTGYWSIRSNSSKKNRLLAPPVPTTCVGSLRTELLSETPLLTISASPERQMQNWYEALPGYTKTGIIACDTAGR